MTVTFIGNDRIPNFLALTSDIRDNGTLPAAGLIGKLVYFSDDGSWGVILPNLKIGGYTFGTGTTGTEPTFVSAEIGTVNDTTLVLTLSENIISANVSAPNYLAGFSVKVNGVDVEITSATRQTNHAIIYFVLVNPIVFGDIVSIEYNSEIGGIRSQTGTVYLNSFSEDVTNNVPLPP